MKKRSIQKRLRPTLSSPEGEMGKGDLEPRIKRLKIDYPATNDVIDGRVKLTEALPQVKIRTKKITVALNPEETFNNKKHKWRAQRKLKISKIVFLQRTSKEALQASLELVIVLMNWCLVVILL